MALKHKPELTTELKDLDVDRVDGVDKPATGRAFALFKRAVTDDVLMIEKVLKELYPSEEEKTRRLIEQACDDNITKCTADGKPDGTVVGYIVRGSDVSSPLMSFESAVALVARAIKGELAAGRRAAGKPVDDELMTHLGPGVAAPVAEDGPTDVFGNPHKVSADDDDPKGKWWDMHTNDGASIDGARQPSKTPGRNKPRLL